ncbi:MAG: hypothetical protein DRP55_02870 [Spirochaetes bacterium]|nr:MAG: hypothetical protein DRP55_02870 [Spirochaetota bacterium]
MPGLDGTGPLGLGPMTGRGLGYCATPSSSNRYRWFGPYGPWGGWGLGWGRGWRWQAGWWPPYGGGWGYPPYTPEQELEMLKDEANFYEQELEAIRARIKELEKVKEPKE